MSYAQRARELAQVPGLTVRTTDPQLLAAAEKFIRRKRDDHRLMMEKALALALAVVDCDERKHPLPIELDEELACFVAALHAHRYEVPR